LHIWTHHQDKKSDRLFWLVILLQASELGLSSFPVWGDKHAELTAA
jgi:hypothetical protein